MDFIADIPWWGWVLAYVWIQVAWAMSAALYRNRERGLYHPIIDIASSIAIGACWPLYLPAMMLVEKID